jgi:toxin CcdB
MIVQNDFYEDLTTRAIIPLMRNAYLPPWQHPLVPEVNIEFETFMLFSPMITNLNNKLIKREDFICNLKSARGEVISAIDALITNT